MDFREGHNCWKVAKAGRVAFLVDGEIYFEAVAKACEAAAEAIYIIGWDIDSRIRLRRGNRTNAETFGRFLDRLARERPGLHIYLLEWDFAMLYSLERETWPLLSFGWRTHERVHFELDDDHPVGASHHQKIVVVDDTIAFVGGFDLASSRWDTSAHAPQQQNRSDNGEPYGPFHDVQMLVEGEAAAMLGKLARYRWEKATGELLSAPGPLDASPWPDDVHLALKEVPVAILRTIPEHDGAPEAREIEQFYLDAIASAKSSIYCENQYFTSHRIGQAFEQSLSRDDGPEILLVLPRHCSGWLEQETMGALRQRLLHRLLEADRHQRLKVCYPDRDDLGSDIINVHSKLLVIDNQVLTIGSANLSNRSMGLDTECNLALAAHDNDDISKAIASLRNQLLAEHLGTTSQEVSDRLAETGSVLATVEACNQGERRLHALPAEQTPTLSSALSTDEIVDPERPVDVDRLLEHLGIGPDLGDETTRTRQKAKRFGLLLALALLLAMLWRWSPLNQWVSIDALLNAAETIRQSPLTIPIVLVIYVIGSCLMFPITLLILATALSFGPYTGFALAFCGSLLGGLTSYLAGRWLGRDVVRKLAGDKLNRLSRKIAKRGWLAIAIVRVVPIAPFTIVNMVSGATHISARSFLIGTGVGMGPGIMAIMIFEGGLEQAVRNPNWTTLAWAFIAICCAALILVLGKRWLTRREEGTDA